MIEGADAEPHGKEIHPGADEGIKLEFATFELHLSESGDVLQEHELFAENRSLLREGGTLCTRDSQNLFVSDLQFDPGQTEFIQVHESPLMLCI